MFDHILETIAPRIGVDKTPRTVLSAACLERAYEMYPYASFLHLTRHPRSTDKSLLNSLKRNSEWGGTFSADSIDPEGIWLRAHTNIHEFASTLPEGQCLRIKGEELLTDPDLYLPQIAEWLGLDTDPAAIDVTLHPENSPYACYGPDDARMGNDPEFFLFNERAVHGSTGNPTDGRRLGFSTRVTTPDVKVYHEQTVDGQGYSLENYGCVLIRGEDQYGHNHCIEPEFED